MNNDFFTQTMTKTFEETRFQQQEEAGIVIAYADGMCTVAGLFHVAVGELVLFDNGNSGIVFDLSDEVVFVFVFIADKVTIGGGVRRTKYPFSLVVSEQMLGRVIDVSGTPIDGLGEIIADPLAARMNVESEPKGIIARKPVNQALNTGILIIDGIVPIGRGQRQLLFGNRGTGKTTAALTAMINQKDSEVVCIYVAAGIQQSQSAYLQQVLKQHGALSHTIIVSADAGKPALHQYIAPYVGSAIAEYFAHHKKKDVLIVYDDLSNQAIAYRELCLLMKRPPSREAYPGDVFYLHARLLERAGNFLSGGSITALPIAKLQEDDISAYVPTNLISITDGQIFFDTKLFNRGIKPAINPELSVSRVGGAAQPMNINKLSRALRLDLAQYHELSVFSQFGGELNTETEELLVKGALLVSLLRQGVTTRYSVAEQAILLYAYRKWYKDLLKVTKLPEFIAWLLEYIAANKPLLCTQLNGGTVISEEQERELDEILDESFTIVVKGTTAEVSAHSSAG